MRWIALSLNAFPSVKPDNRLSACQHEFRMKFTDTPSFKPRRKSHWPHSTRFSAEFRHRNKRPRRNGKAIFPERAEATQPIVQIAAVIGILTLNSWVPIEGVDVQSCVGEEALIKAFLEFIHRADQDVITGYNTSGFDIPYVLRAKHLSLSAESRCSSTLIPLTFVLNSVVGFEIQNVAFRKSDRYDKLAVVPDRLQLDLFNFVSLEMGLCPRKNLRI
ncbi:hypothetical protein BT96DRAFT_1013257 [Gymnopus androsaceus JB14]|uniref:DNA polymerase delta catalytic subunit n=1 Tax=Gymnopus androsaceus JB14 TaxID=1447944 RepID=A0A6A4IDH7_9AGAR|nr:hypothetical protein BT96DRAFT_1013257 [Gymnopus androsaceus JB14]